MNRVELLGPLRLGLSPVDTDAVRRIGNGSLPTGDSDDDAFIKLGLLQRMLRPGDLDPTPLTGLVGCFERLGLALSPLEIDLVTVLEEYCADETSVGRVVLYYSLRGDVVPPAVFEALLDQNSALSLSFLELYLRSLHLSGNRLSSRQLRQLQAAPLDAFCDSDAARVNFVTGLDFVSGQLAPLALRARIALLSGESPGVSGVCLYHAGLPVVLWEPLTRSGTYP